MQRKVLQKVWSLLLIFVLCKSVLAEYPVNRPKRKIPAPDSGNYIIYSDKQKQVVWGMGFEIQSDSIASGNEGLPEATTSVPHDLTPSERQRFYKEMLKGFRYCRLAGGLYWRGTDPEGKYLQPRWPKQLEEIKEMLDTAGIEGVSLEYWSPAPFWKANRKYTGRDGTENILRCFGKDFVNDSVYHGDIDKFLKDYALACVKDIETLQKAGIQVSMWGLSNEPWVDSPYSSCKFKISEYGQTFKAVAPLIRSHNSTIKIIADTMWGWPKYIADVMKEPEYAGYIDALVVHAIGADSKSVIANLKQTRNNIKQKLPLFQNEYEYLKGPASAERCLNTVQNIMNWYQLAESPTWFWIHALKPFKNAEASGYSLGFWMPTDPNYMSSHKVKASTEDTITSTLKPGHWTWNKYNWYSVAGFLKYMPWDSKVVDVREEVFDNDMRILSYKKPDGKLVIVLSNRCFKGYTFKIKTGIKHAAFKGYRYTPEEAGVRFMGIPIGCKEGPDMSIYVPDLTWEFWIQQ